MSSQILNDIDFKPLINNIIDIEYNNLKDYIYSDICDEEIANYYDNEFNETDFYALYFYTIGSYTELVYEMQKALYTGALGRRVSHIARKNNIINYEINNNIQRNIIDYIYDRVEDVIDIERSPYDNNYLNNCDFRKFCKNVEENIKFIYETFTNPYHCGDDVDKITYNQFIDLLKSKLFVIGHIMYMYKLDINNIINNNEINSIIDELVQNINEQCNELLLDE